MNSKLLMEEYDLEIDDIRWFLSVRLSEEILSLYQEPKKLITMIWNKDLESELYNMEEKFLADIDDRLTRGLGDEVKIRQLFSEIRNSKRRRRPPLRK